MTLPTTVTDSAVAEGSRQSAGPATPPSQRLSGYEQATERIIHLMQHGVVPWQKSWSAGCPERQRPTLQRDDKVIERERKGTQLTGGVECDSNFGMGTERDQRQVTECICGQGTVDEHFWANDHPFASDYGWHSEGIRLNCKACGENWTISESVANPVTPPAGKRVVYFVRLEDAKAAALHNGAVDKRISAIEKEQRELEAKLEGKLRLLKKELLELLDQDASLQARYAAVGAFLGIATCADFRAKVGRTLPKTYIPQLVTDLNMSQILQRMGRAADVEEIRTTRAAIAQKKHSIPTLQASKKRPTAADHRFGPA